MADPAGGPGSRLRQPGGETVASAEDDLVPRVGAAADRARPRPAASTTRRDYWAADHRRTGAAGRPRTAPNTTASQRSVTVRLDRARDPRRCCRTCPAVYRTQVNDVLLAALGRVLCRWTGRDRVLVDLEGHGREELFDGVDLSRTVGWFTTMFPVALDAAGRGLGRRRSSRSRSSCGPCPGGARLRRAALPHRADRADATHRRSASTTSASSTAGRRRRASGSTAGPGTRTRAAPARRRRPGRTRTAGAHLVLLRPSCTTSRPIARLAEEMLVRRCARSSSTAPGRTPVAAHRRTSRWRGWTRPRWTGWPATAARRGHLPAHADAGGHGVPRPGQATGRLLRAGQLRAGRRADPRRARPAWQRVVDRTPMLRSSVVWEGVPEPLQVVHRDAPLPVAPPRLDRPATEDERGRGCAELLDARPGRGHRPGTAPLMRLTLARLSGDRGAGAVDLPPRAAGRVERVPGARRRARRRTPGGASGQPVRRVPGLPASGCGDQDSSRAEEHWRGVLAGFSEPTPLPYDRTPRRRSTSASSTAAAADLAWASRVRRLLRVRPRAAADAEHGRAGRVGAAAVPLQRPARRVLRRHGVRPARRPARRRRRSPACSSTPCRSGSTWTATAPVAAVAARPAGRAGRGAPVRVRAAGPAAGLERRRRPGSTCSTASWCSRTTRSTRAAACGCAARSAVETTNYPLTATVYPERRAVAAARLRPRRCSTRPPRSRLGEHLRALLTAIAADAGPAARRGAAAHRRRAAQVLVEWNDTAQDGAVTRRWSTCSRPGDPTPQAVAVCEGGRLTYAELDARANRLAH